MSRLNKLLRIVGGASLVAVVAFSGVASAQTAPTVSGTTTGPNTAIVFTDGTGGSVVNGVTRVAPGSTGQTLATIELASSQTRPVLITSVPVTISFSSGATPTNLTNCQLFNQGGAALTTGARVLNSPVNGTNTIALDNPLTIGAGSTQRLTVRCNIASTAPAGATFTLGVATPVAAAFPATLTITSTAVPVIQDNTVTIPNVTFGMLRFDAAGSSSDIRITAIPFTASTIGAATASSVSNCQLFDSNGVALNSGANAGGTVVTGQNSITLNTPFTMAVNGSATLALRCTVLPGTGGTIVIFPGAGTPFPATPTTPGLPITVTFTTFATSPVALGGTGGPVVDPTIPGVPSTGLGTRGIELAGIMAALAAVLVGGGIYLRNRQRQNA